MSPAGRPGDDCGLFSCTDSPCEHVRCESCGSVRDPAEMLEALSPSWEPMPGVFLCRDSEACFAAASREPLEAMLERRGARGTWVCGCCGREQSGSDLKAVTDDIDDLFICRDTDDCMRAFQERHTPKLRQWPGRTALDRVEAWLAGIDPAEELLGAQIIDGLRAAIDGTPR